MNQDKLPVESTEPINCEDFLPGADCADVGEEVLVVGSGGEGELSEYLSAIH